MKMPNFRLHETQATAAMIVAVIGLIFLMGLSLVALKGLDIKNSVIPYNEKAGFSQYRKPLVFAAGPVCIVLGMTAGILGFRSLGQPKNHKQGRSWLGMTIGAVIVALAPVIMAAWVQLSEPIIVAPPGSGGQRAASTP